MGIEKVKQLLHEKVYFLGIDKAAEDMIKNCLPCQCVSHPDPPRATENVKISTGPMAYIKHRLSWPYFKL